MNWRTIATWGPRLTLVVVLLVANLALVAAMSTSGTPYSPYNHGWDGTSELRDRLADIDVTTTTALDTATYTARRMNRTVAFVLEPVGSYRPSEIAPIDRLLANGGTLVVAAENGTRANDLLDAVGADARIGRRVLRDERSNYRSSALPIVVPTVSDPQTAVGRAVASIDSVTLNHGATVMPHGVRVLLSTQSTAYLDTNGNATLDEGEPIGRQPVATIESVGPGNVIVVGDPSVFTNAMLKRDGNRAFLTALATGAERAVIDLSHGRPLPPLPYTLLLIRRTPLLQVLVSLVAVAGIVFWYRSPDLPSPWPWSTEPDPGAPALDEDDLSAFLRDRHPDWDDEQVRRVTKAIIRRRQNPEDND